MDTLKTGFIVLLLLAVLYGVYVVLNKDQTPPNAEIAWHQQQAEQELQIDIGSATNDPAKARVASGKSATEPNLLATPGNDPTATKSAVLGSPSIVTAEPSPPAVPPARVDAIPDTLAKSPSAQAPGETSIGLNAVPQPSPLTTGRTVPDSNSSEVSAPSLLATRSTAESQASVTGSNTLDRPRDLTNLPALREPPTTWPDSKPPTVEAKPELRASESTEVATVPTGTNPVPLLANGTSPDIAAISAEPNTSVPSDSTPNAATDSAPVLKSVSTAAAFEAALREAQSNLAAEQWYQALFVLSKFYGSPDLSPQQERDLIDLLDPLAAKVVYSQEHLITNAHEVRRGDTLAQIAAANQVPPELLSNINGIENPDLLVPGTKLKMVRGPFRADIHLQKKELTLFAGQLYAGRFPISLGQDPEPQPGEYRVLEKQPGHDYFPQPSGQIVGTFQNLAADDPQNPFGRVWISLDKGLAIHGSPEQGDSGTRGCISLSPLDAADVYSILTQGSSVTIRR